MNKNCPGVGLAIYGGDSHLRDNQISVSFTPG